MFETREQAQEFARKTRGWLNVSVCEDIEPDITGAPIIWVEATDPTTGKRVSFDGPHSYARTRS